jgi:hypothetical protein
MLLPENPEKRPSLWDGVAAQLAHESMCFIIEDGVGDTLAEARGPGSEVADLALPRLRALPICRISANRGKAVSPHFAGSYEKNAVTLAEFLTTPSEGAITVDDEKLKRDLETAVINLFFAHEGISTVFVPLSLAPWEMPDAEVALLPDGLAFRKKA